MSPTYDSQDGGAPLHEPEITINGIKLTFSQALTVRVALQHFGLWCQGEAKEMGALGKNYRERINEINRMIMP